MAGDVAHCIKECVVQDLGSIDYQPADDQAEIYQKCGDEEFFYQRPEVIPWNVKYRSVSHHYQRDNEKHVGKVSHYFPSLLYNGNVRVDPQIHYPVQHHH